MLPSETFEASANGAYSQSGQSLGVWADYRRILTGKTRDVVEDHLRRTFPETWADGAMPLRYGTIAEFVLRQTAGAWEDTPLVTTQDKDAGKPARALFRRWKSQLDQNWKLRASAGASFLHLASRGGRLELDHLYGDHVAVVPDPDAPTDWERVQKCVVLAHDNRRIVYERTPEGLVTVAVTDELGEIKTGPDPLPWATIPVFPSYRRFYGDLVPEPDQSLLDLQKSFCEMLSHVDHRRFFKVDKIVISSSMAGEGMGASVRPVEVKAGHHQWMEMGHDEQAQNVSQTFDSVREIEYIEHFMRLMLVCLGLPVELLDNKSRAETGAAKTVDRTPIIEYQEADREAAKAWAADFLEWLRPMLDWAGVIPEDVELALTPPPVRRTLPADIQSWVQGMDMGARVGLIDLVREYAERYRVGVSVAKKALVENAKLHKELREISADARLQVDPKEPK